MRSPLNTIQATASYLAALGAGEQVSEAAGLLLRSGKSMQFLLDDLVDFNRTMLGQGIKVVPSQNDLSAVVADELEQLRMAYLNRRIELASAGDLRGLWDGERMQQLLRNLVSNAIHHGVPDEPVRVVLRGEEAAVRLEVTNSGPAIDPSALSQIFEPLIRGPVQGEARAPGRGLGLGLYIVREIAKAHGGEVEVRCGNGATTFAVRLPRQ
jgi:signal transduction histidine kinase